MRVWNRGDRWKQVLCFLAGLAIASCIPVSSFAKQDSVKRIEKVESPEKLIKRLGFQTQTIFHDGDRITFLFRTNATKAGLTTMFNAPFKKVGRNGPYIGQVEIPNSDRLLMSYAFTENDENGRLNLKEYRGKNAPEIPQSIERIEGSHFRYQIESKFLEEDRRFEVYVPKTNGESNLPVAYLTDGRALESYIGALDLKIQNGEIAPVILVGVHSGGYVGDRNKISEVRFDYRAQEYLSGLGSERYEKHKKFFHAEVIPFVEKHHNASSKRKDRILSGYSNGGAYAITASVDHPEIFGNVFAYSVAFFIGSDLEEAVQGKDLPTYRLAAGTLESFIRGTRQAQGIFDKAKVNSQIRTYVADHDPLLWKVALLDDLKWLFPGLKSKAK